MPCRALHGTSTIMSSSSEPLFRYPVLRTSSVEEFEHELVDIYGASGFDLEGSEELKVDVDTLENIQIVRKGAAQVVSNFSVVRVVGCLTPGPNNTWTLTNTTEPVLSRDQASTPEELKRADGLPAGKQNFRLVSVSGFGPQQNSGKKMDVKGLLYKDDTDARINVTSLQLVGACTAK